MFWDILKAKERSSINEVDRVDAWIVWGKSILYLSVILFNQVDLKLE